MKHSHIFAGCFLWVGIGGLMTSSVLLPILIQLQGVRATTASIAFAAASGTLIVCVLVDSLYSYLRRGE